MPASHNPNNRRPPTWPWSDFSKNIGGDSAAYDNRPYRIDAIVDTRLRHLPSRRHKTRQYRVRWNGWGPNWDSWIAAQGLKGCAALDEWDRFQAMPREEPDIPPDNPWIKYHACGPNEPHILRPEYDWTFDAR
ncbi:hypothetical protein D9611_011814 [Ephemerocybe angulata]|uniref:Chromo domain-containing protein n=1 Tax=Ephemerocybe angulata TaxID=980116 RepID=A0A8H5BXZ0_9AGAR|nr:hypothetical protein D9611_011814 [Tulosesus angulatus]